MSSVSNNTGISFKGDTVTENSELNLGNICALREAFLENNSLAGAAQRIVNAWKNKPLTTASPIGQKTILRKLGILQEIIDANLEKTLLNFIESLTSGAGDKISPKDVEELNAHWAARYGETKSAIPGDLSAQKELLDLLVHATPVSSPPKRGAEAANGASVKSATDLKSEINKITAPLMDPSGQRILHEKFSTQDRGKSLEFLTRGIALLTEVIRHGVKEGEGLAQPMANLKAAMDGCIQKFIRDLGEFLTSAEVEQLKSLLKDVNRMNLEYFSKKPFGLTEMMAAKTLENAITKHESSRSSSPSIAASSSSALTVENVAKFCQKIQREGKEMSTTEKAQAEGWIGAFEKNTSSEIDPKLRDQIENLKAVLTSFAPGAEAALKKANEAATTEKLANALSLVTAKLESGSPKNNEDAKGRADILSQVRKLRNRSSQLESAVKRLEQDLDSFSQKEIENFLKISERAVKDHSWACKGLLLLHTAKNGIGESTKPLVAKLRALLQAYVGSLKPAANSREARQIADLIGWRGQIDDEKMAVSESVDPMNRLDGLIKPYIERAVPISSVKPIGLPNQGNTCFAAAWMQNVALNPHLLDAYSQVLPKTHRANQFLQKYQVGIANIAPLNEGKQQQDVGELVADDGREIATPLEKKFKDGENVPFAAIVSELVYEKKSENGPFVHDPSKNQPRRVEFPLSKLNFNKQDPNPTLAGMIKYTYENQESQIGNEADRSKLTYNNLSKTTVYNQLPPVQIYNMINYDYNPQGRPRLFEKSEVEVPLVHTMTDISGATATYVLTGLVSYYGDGVAGHYTSHVIHNGIIYHLNDSEVKTASLSDYLEKARRASLLVYTRSSIA
jgi:hypothetical protein